MTAISRQAMVSCVIAADAPTDLVDFPRPSSLGTVIHQFIAPYVPLASWSAALLASRIRCPVLLEHAYQDPIVPFAQSREMARALPRARLIGLRPGTAPGVHGTVDPRDLHASWRAERTLLRTAPRARVH
jgi:pimeloyl-ACP methyl ester carboxylesterase